mmetsp:Transcript_48010/g.120256  ORF Transcript_48010/g.120256 Transcript_48010/m.120256 type:complete len:427 (-) Transcript_48010:164-1444(-)
MSEAGADDDGVVEHETQQGRYVRYNELLGQGRFKRVYRGFDERQGTDVAWAKIDGVDNGLSTEEMEQVLREVQDGQKLKHDNIINTHLAWYDTESHCINFVTELFTSGNLRDYRMKHKHLGMKAIRKWGKQLLAGLEYLHNQDDGPLIHGDLRCDKIYINGHTGDIKIGDLGLTTLLERRYREKAVSGEYSNLVQANKIQADVYCFGLCMLELMTLEPLDPTKQPVLDTLLGTVKPAEAHAFVKRCLVNEGPAPTAAELMQDDFFTKPDEKDGGMSRSKSINMRASMDAGAASVGGSVHGGDGDGEQDFSSDLNKTLGSLKGDQFQFNVEGERLPQGGGKLLQLKLTMKRLASEDSPMKERGGRAASEDFSLQFQYDLEKDDPQSVVGEMTGYLPDMWDWGEMSDIDRDICTSALAEGINKLEAQM